MGHPFFTQLAAAAVVIAAAVIAASVTAQHIAAAVAEQEDQDDDPANVTAAETVIVTHKNYLRKFLRGCLPLIPRYSEAAIWCRGRRYLCINGMRAILKPKKKEEI